MDTWSDASALFPGGREAVVAGQLAVRWDRHQSTSIVWLSGVLDEATVTLLDRELDERAIGTTDLTVDLTGVAFIDPVGLDALVGINWRASERGDRLSFRYGSSVAHGPVELSRTVQLPARWCSVGDEDFDSALAVACADVGHPLLGDRPEAV